MECEGVFVLSCRLVPSGAPASGSSCRLDQSELLEDGDTVVETEFLGDQSVLDLDDRDAGEPHRLAGVGWECADGHVVEGISGVGASADPLADDVVTFGNEVGPPAEREVGVRGAELCGEGAYCVAATAGCVQGVLEADVGPASSSMISGLKSVPQNSVNHRPTTALLSSMLMIFLLRFGRAPSERCRHEDVDAPYNVRCDLRLESPRQARVTESTTCGVR
jgi:hypothetical protein